MKVKRLIDILNLMDPDAEVCIETKDSNIATSVSQIVVTDPYRLPGVYVYIGDNLLLIEKETTGHIEVSYSEVQDLDKRGITR